MKFTAGFIVTFTERERNLWIVWLRHAAFENLSFDIERRELVEKGMPLTYKTSFGLVILSYVFTFARFEYQIRGQLLRIALLVLFAILIDDMHRKLRPSFFAFSIILLLCLILNTGAQLNFSTGWGKRSQRIGVVEWGVRTECATQAKPSVEQLLSVYHLIQIEARKMLDCRKLNEWIWE